MNAKKRNIYEKVINIVLDILIALFGIFLLIFIYNNVQVKILGNEYSSFFGYSTFEVQTGSMADTINPGDWIVVKVTKNVKLNDIITYSQKGDFITHRVVETYKDSFITKGDANNSKDNAINKSQIVGKVVKILPYFGIIRKTFFNPLVLLTLMLTLYSISYVLRNIKNDDINLKEKKYNYKEKMDDIVDYVLTKLLSYIKNKLKNNDSKSQEDIEFDLSNEEKEYNADELHLVMPEVDESDMDKTLYFRKITVDKEELDNIESTERKPKINDDEYINDNILEKIEENEIEEKVQLIQNKRKKFKNIVEKAMYFKKEEINKIIDILLLEETLQTNESSIKEAILNAYIDGKYYNFCGDVNVEFNKKTIYSRIEQEIQKKGDELISEYKGSDSKYSQKVNKYITAFKLLNRLEKINTTTSDIKKKRKLYKQKLLKISKLENLSSNDLKNMINKILKTQKLYQYMIDFILEKAKTSTFNLTINKISGNKNMYAVSVDHNIMFSKVYSDYIVDKTYTEGIIAEDKVMVLLNLLLVNIVRDMLDLEANKQYFIHIPDSLYSKPNKLDKIFKLLEDEYAKNNIIVVVDCKSLIEYNEQILKLRKAGYKFAIILNNDLKKRDNKYLEIAEYLFSDKKMMTYSLISSIPSDLTKKIITDDIISKLSSFGGE